MSKVTSNTPSAAEKPHVLFVRNKKSKGLVNFQETIEDETITMLSQYLDVTVIQRDFDYGEICDTHNPDFVIFESPGGTNTAPLEIANIAARMDIPRIGFSMQDPHDTSRVLWAQQMEAYRFDRYFITAAAALRQSPELADSIFLLPLYFNPAIYRDYGLEKDIPLSIFGGLMAPEFYHWRAELGRDIADFMPTFIYTHPGYGEKPAAHRYPVSGEAYAKMLNRSHYSVADTTRLDYVVRKHLEIPACGSVLISPDTPDMGFYGFRDRENCILGSGEVLREKIAQVSANPDLYRTIATNGHNLVHSRYTLAKRTEILDWFNCRKALRPGEVVQQQGIFGSFSAVAQSGDTPAVRAEISDSEFTRIMKAARIDILRGENLPETAKKLIAIIGWCGHIGEPWVPLAIIGLLRGNVANAKDFLMAGYKTRLGRDRTTCFDPEELAWMSLIGALTGDQEALSIAHMHASGISHVSLRRMQWLPLVLGGRADIKAPPADLLARQAGDRRSIHWMGETSLTEWLGVVTRILAVYGMGEFLPPQQESC